MRKGDALCCRITPLQVCLDLKGRNALASSQSFHGCDSARGISVRGDRCRNICLSRTEGAEYAEEFVTSDFTFYFRLHASYFVQRHAMT